MSGSSRTRWLARPASCVGIINAQINRELTQSRTGLKRSLAGTMAAFVCVHWGLGAFKKVAFGFLCLHVGALQLWKLDEISVFQEFCFDVTSLACFSRPATFRLCGRQSCGCKSCFITASPILPCYFPNEKRERREPKFTGNWM